MRMRSRRSFPFASLGVRMTEQKERAAGSPLPVATRLSRDGRAAGYLLPVSVLLHQKYVRQLRGGPRTSEEIPLHVRAAPLQQMRQLLFRFDSLGHDAHVEPAGHGDHG